MHILKVNAIDFKYSIFIPHHRNIYFQKLNNVMH